MVRGVCGFVRVRRGKRGGTYGFRDQERGEDTGEHESGKDLHNVVEPWGFVGRGRSASALRANDELRKDRTELTRRSGNTVGGRAVPGRETLAGNDEGGRVGSEVEEELAEHVQSEQRCGAEGVEREADDAEDDGQEGESHELDGLSSDGVDGEDSDPVTRDGACTNQDQVSDGVVVQLVVDVGLRCVANLREDDGIVKTETIERDIEKEPRPSSSEKNLSEAPLSVVAVEIGPRCLGNIELSCGLHSLNTADLINISSTGSFAGKVGLGICVTPLDVTGNIESVSRGFGDGQTVVEGDASGHGAEADNNTPHSVNGSFTSLVALVDFVCGDGLGFESNSDNEGHECSDELTDSLHRENSSHHCPTPFCSCESGIECQLGGDLRNRGCCQGSKAYSEVIIDERG